MANLKALGMLPVGVDAAALQQMQSLVAGLGQHGYSDVAALAKLASLMKGMDPAALELFVELVPQDDLDKWHTAIGTGSFLLGKEYRLALSNMGASGFSVGRRP